MPSEFARARSEARHAPRHRVDVTTWIETEDGVRVPFDLTNLSNMGCAGMGDVDVQPGDHVTVHVPLLAGQPATVIWSYCDKIGIDFIQVIDTDAVLDHLHSGQSRYRAGSPANLSPAHVKRQAADEPAKGSL